MSPHEEREREREREIERDEGGERFPEFDDVYWSAPNPYVPKALLREVEDDRMSDGCEPTDVQETLESS